MVDEVRVLRLLRSVSDDLTVLGDESTAGVERRSDPLWLRGVKYTFITAIEGCVDVAQHLCSSQGWGPPADNAEAVRTIARHGVVDAALGERLARAVGFRNVLVHEYVQVDDAVVVDRLEDPSDLAAFVTAVADWLNPDREAQRSDR